MEGTMEKLKAENRRKYASDVDEYGVAASAANGMADGNSVIQSALNQLSSEIAAVKEDVALLAAKTAPVLRGGTNMFTEHGEYVRVASEVKEEIAPEDSQSDLAANLAGLTESVRNLAVFVRNVLDVFEL
jgi:hypothetical protein